MNFSPVLPGFNELSGRLDDVVYTPEDVDIINKFRPCGRILDPCSGAGAFLDNMPSAEWCEITKGRDFFEWTEPVDWIVSNPPYSIFIAFLRKSFQISTNIVYLIPINKIFSSDKLIRQIWEWGGIKAIYYVGDGASLGFPMQGYCIGAVHFLKEYKGCTDIIFRK